MSNYLRNYENYNKDKNNEKEKKKKVLTIFKDNKENSKSNNRKNQEELSESSSSEQLRNSITAEKFEIRLNRNNKINYGYNNKVNANDFAQRLDKLDEKTFRNFTNINYYIFKNKNNKNNILPNINNYSSNKKYNDFINVKKGFDIKKKDSKNKVFNINPYDSNKNTAKHKNYIKIYKEFIPVNPKKNLVNINKYIRDKDDNNSRRPKSNIRRNFSQDLGILKINFNNNKEEKKVENKVHVSQSSKNSLKKKIKDFKIVTDYTII